MMPVVDKLYTADEVAEILHVHVQTVRVWIRTGVMGHYPIGNRKLISPDQLQTFLDAHRQDPDA